MEEILNHPDNQYCADCSSPKPRYSKKNSFAQYRRWASVHIGALICFHCAAVHRSLGVHHSFIMSCVLDIWTDAQLHELRQRGNAKVNDQYEFAVPKKYMKPNAMSSLGNRKRYIMAKYVEGMFLARQGQTRLPPVSEPASLLGLQNPHPQGMVEYAGIIKIELIEAKDIMPMDIRGSCNPYVLFRLGGQSIHSQKIKTCLAPRWNEHLLLPWDGIDALIIELYDSKLTGKDRVIGTATIQGDILAGLSEPQALDVWQPIVLKKYLANTLTEHVAVGLKGMGKGLYSGVTGIWNDPSRGAQEGGLKGLIQGVGSGLVGVVFNPLKGTCKLVKETARGIKECIPMSKKRKLKSRSKEVIYTISGCIHFRLTFQSLDH